jgi:hypothetical protein
MEDRLGYNLRQWIGEYTAQTSRRMLPQVGPADPSWYVDGLCNAAAKVKWQLMQRR